MWGLPATDVALQAAQASVEFLLTLHLSDSEKAGTTVRASFVDDGGEEKDAAPTGAGTDDQVQEGEKEEDMNDWKTEKMKDKNHEFWEGKKLSENGLKMFVATVDERVVCSGEGEEGEGEVVPVFTDDVDDDQGRSDGSSSGGVVTSVKVQAWCADEATYLKVTDTHSFLLLACLL